MAGSPVQVVLIADDDPSMRLVLATALNQAGFLAIEASDGESAIDRFTSERPDLVLLDVEMPGMNGYETCAKIRSMPGGSSVPIVMVTGHEDTRSIDNAYEAGATDFIPKPINWSLLGHRLRYIMRGAENLHALKASEYENRALLRAIPDLICIVREDGSVQRILSTSVRVGNVTPEALLNRNIVEMLPAKAANQAQKAIHAAISLGRHESIEFESTDKGGPKRYYESRFVPHRRNQAMAIIRDISERKHAEAKIHRLAHYDTLTGLPNRRLFLEGLRQAIEIAHRNEESLATLYIDLDNFKRINDTLGHSIGDIVLKSVADRLMDCVNERILAANDRRLASLARLGGDEFVVLISGLARDNDGSEAARHITEALSKPLLIDGRELVVTPSIGISTYPQHGKDTVDLLKNADSAMYKAKAAGRNNFKVYLDAMNAGELERLDIESELRQALDKDALEVHFQPKFDGTNLRLTGAEALIRWHHPERGAISPTTIIGLAEESDLIIELDRWVTSTVVRQMAAWKTQGLPVVPIAVNLSGQEFCARDPIEFLCATLRDNGIDPAMLEIEITESVLMDDALGAKRSLAKLKQLGFRLSIDDFGTGYSSLSYLKQFELDSLKIDRSFIRDVGHDSGGNAICASIISMAHDLGLSVVAEGVENYGQLSFLRNKSCDQIQGFLLSKPMGAERFTALLSETQNNDPSRVIALREVS